jgi:biopolymer transport protein ExbD
MNIHPTSKPFSPSSHLSSLAQPDFTPLMDIVLQLLIFFLLTSSFALQPALEVHLAQAATALPISTPRHIRITIAAGGSLYLDDRPVTLSSLQAQLNHPSFRFRPVLIRADRQVPLGHVVAVWDVCRRLGITEIQIAATPLGDDNRSLMR